MVFFNVLSSLVTIEYYAKTFGMGEADHTALLIESFCIGFLGLLYYYLFSNMSKIFEKFYKKSEKRYY
jgi:hypothetical protein